MVLTSVPDPLSYFDGLEDIVPDVIPKRKKLKLLKEHRFNSLLFSLGGFLTCDKKIKMLVWGGIHC